MPAGAGKRPSRRTPALGDPRAAAQALKTVLARKVEACLALGDLDRDTADELAKIAAAIAKLEGHAFDLKTAALEVCERLADFVGRGEADQARRAWLADQLEAFLASLEQGA